MQTLDIPFATRFLAPKRRPSAVRRARLHQSLQANLDRKVQVLWAPAGYGKTTLLSESLADAPNLTCWYLLTQDDKDPREFARSCVNAVRVCLPDFGHTVPQLGAFAPDRDWRTDIGLLVTAFVNEVPEKLVFIIDDLHNIEDYSEVNEALSLLVERSPDSVHFAISSRMRPSLACLPRLYALDEVAYVTGEDMSFSIEETSEVLSRLWSRNVSNDESRTIHEWSKGWITGIVLAARVREDGGLGVDLPVIHREHLFEYLAKEVVDRLPQQLRTFALRSSVVETFTVDFLNKLLETTRSDELIRQVLERGLPVEERPGPTTSYRYHDLLHEFLERQYSREEPEEYRALNLWAAQLFESQENYSAAVNHRVKVEAYEEAAATVIAARGPYLKQGSWRALQAMLATLPAGVVDRDPELSLTHADLLLRLGDPGKALETMDRILSRPETLRGELEGRARTIKSFALRLVGHLERAEGEAEQGVRLIKLNNGRAEDLSEAFRQLACALGTQGKWEEAKQNFVLALSLVGEWNTQLVSLIHLGLGCTLMEKGELYEALAHFEKARQGWHQLGDLGSLADTINNISVILFRRGDFELALEELDQGIEYADETGNRRALATALVRKGMTLEALDRCEEGLTCLRKGLEVARAIPDLRLVAYATSELGNGYRKQGRASEGQTLVERALVDAEESNLQYSAARYRLALGKIHWHLGAKSEALQQLSQACQALSRLGNVHVLAEATLWEALVHYRSDEIAKATERLEETARLVTVLGYQGFLLADARDLYPVIRFAAAKRLGRGVYGRLLEQIVERAGPDPSPSRPARLVSSALPAIGVQGFLQTRVFLEGHEVTAPEWRSRKAKELLLFLLCRRRATTKEELIDALWPKDTSMERSSTLKTTIYRLRQALYPELTVSDASGYFLNPDAPLKFDLYEFEHCLDAAGGLDNRNLSNSRMERLEKAVEIYKGPFVNEFYAEWCQPLQRELEVKFRTTLQTLADHYIALDDYARAISVLLKAVSSDPYDELANYRLIQAYDLAGDIHSARQRREVYHKLVREDLGEDLPKCFSGIGGPNKGL